MQSGKIADRYDRLRDIRRRHGAAAVLCHLLNRVAKRVLLLDGARLLWLEAEAVRPTAPSVEEFTFRFLDAAEVRRFAADPGNHLNPALADQLGANVRCFAALAGERLAAYGWYALGTVDPRHCGGVALDLPPGTAYFYNGFTRPEFRGRQLYVRLIGEGLRAMSDCGVHHLLAAVEWTNWSALKSGRRLGCVDLGCLAGWGCGRWRWLFSPRAARRRGIGFRLVRTAQS